MRIMTYTQAHRHTHDTHIERQRQPEGRKRVRVVHKEMSAFTLERLPPEFSANITAHKHYNKPWPIGGYIWSVTAWRRYIRILLAFRFLGRALGDQSELQQRDYNLRSLPTLYAGVGWWPYKNHIAIGPWPIDPWSQDRYHMHFRCCLVDVCRLVCRPTCWKDSGNVCAIPTPIPTKKDYVCTTSLLYDLFGGRVVGQEPVWRTDNRIRTCLTVGTRNNLGHFRRKYTSDGMWAMLWGSGLCTHRHRERKLYNGDSRMLIIMAFSANGGIDLHNMM